jgi:hypothetical protein
MDVRTEDLITKDDVGDALMRADEGDVIRDKALKDGSDFEEEALETIRSVTGRIQDWLARDLIAAEHTDYMSPRDWSQKRAHPTPATTPASGLCSASQAKATLNPACTSGRAARWSGPPPRRLPT